MLRGARRARCARRDRVRPAHAHSQARLADRRGRRAAAALAFPLRRARPRARRPRAAPARSPNLAHPDASPQTHPAQTPSASLTGASARIASTRRVSTDPGPTSTNVRTPAAVIARTCSTNATGLASWFASRSFAARRVGRGTRRPWCSRTPARRRRSHGPFERGAERAGGVGDERRVERGRDRQPRRLQPGGGQRLRGAVDLGRRARENVLLRRVPVRDHHVELLARRTASMSAQRREHGEHRAGVAGAAVGHQLAAERATARTGRRCSSRPAAASATSSP